MKDYTQKTIPNILNQSFVSFGNYPSLSFVNETPYTYSELKKEISKVIVLLEKNGIVPGDKVAILSGNMPNWGIAFFAITSMGVTAVPILPDFHENEIKNILEHSEAKAIFISEQLFYKIESFNIKTISSTILLNNFGMIPKDTKSDQLKEIKTATDEIITKPKEYSVNEEDIASILYTSGTTGSSKGVMLTHKNIIFDAQKVYSIQYVDNKDVFLSILPLSHTYENTLGLILPIMQGASVYYLDKPPTSSILLPALTKVKPTFLLSVPMVIEKIFKMQILPKFNSNVVISSLYKLTLIRKILHRIAGKKLYKTFGGRLQFFGIGGAKLDARVERFLMEAKFPYAIGYGLTETSPLLAGASPKKAKHQSTGWVMEGVQIKIDNPDPVTGEGEILAKGDNVMKGYYKEPSLTKAVFTEDGWFKTGDLGVFDKDKYLYIKGRLKNMIVGPSGENIYPEEIESVINNFKYVLESVVIEKKGKLTALVYFNIEEIEKQYQHLKQETIHYVQEKSNELLVELQLHVNTRVNKFSQIRVMVNQTSPFEKTPTQKIKRYLYN